MTTYRADPFEDETTGGYYDSPGSGEDRMWHAFSGRRRFGYRSASRDVPEDFQPDEAEWPDDLPGRDL